MSRIINKDQRSPRISTEAFKGHEERHAKDVERRRPERDAEGRFRRGLLVSMNKDSIFTCVLQVTYTDCCALYSRGKSSGGKK